MSFHSLIFCRNSQIISNVCKISKQNNYYNWNLLIPSAVTLSQRRGAARNAKTVKRRKTHPFFWWPQKTKRLVPHKNYLTQENEEFVDNFIKDKYQLKSGESPLKAEQLERGQYTPGSRRCGVIARKIGYYPMWTKTGKRIVTTALQVVDNHVIKFHTPEEWEEICRPFYKNRPSWGSSVVVVGAQSSDPRKFAAAYLGLFKESGVMPKDKLTRFFVSENARLSPGTPLYATHFRVGDYVDVFGKTIDHGFQGVIKRWNFKGQLQHRGVTKAHRRPGTIGRGRKVMGPWKGHKMAGHMGDERRILRGLKIWRINTKYNVIWVHGPAVPGSIHAWNYIYDTSISDKRYSPETPPPFPTYYPEEAEQPLPEDIYDKDLHAFNEPTIIFEETEAERKAAMAAAKVAKKAKIAKIR